MTNPKKLRVGIFFGGQSAEHEVSLQSAKNVVDALDRTKFEPVLIGIDKHGLWHLQESFELLEDGRTFDRIALAAGDGSDSLTLLPGSRERELVSSHSGQLNQPIDVAFPVLHGPHGEDGTIQGFLELANIPYVGAGVLGSAVGMDKDVMKRLLRDAGVPITPFIVVRDVEREGLDLDEVTRQLGSHLFVKPANLGSSVGVSQAINRSELERAIAESFKYDQKILIEKAIVGDEIECSVLGNDRPKASTIGRVIPENDFYSYEAKYLDEKGATLEIPAKIADEIVQHARQTAIKAYETLCCEGMARVDMFANKEGQVLVNEINTIPGFTKISMYPKLWEASGLSYADLITELINLAMVRFEKRRQFKMSLH